MIVRADDVVARRLGSSSIVVNLRTNDIYELNNTATRVWELLEHHASLAALVAQLGAEFSADRMRLTSEVRELLARFEAEGLVTVRDE